MEIPDMARSDHLAASQERGVGPASPPVNESFLPSMDVKLDVGLPKLSAFQTTRDTMEMSCN